MNPAPIRAVVSQLVKPIFTANAIRPMTCHIDGYWGNLLKVNLGALHAGCDCVDSCKFPPPSGPTAPAFVMPHPQLEQTIGEMEKAALYTQTTNDTQINLWDDEDEEEERLVA